MGINVGDIIGFSARSTVGALINIGTFGIPFVDLSHIAIVGGTDSKKFIYESTTLYNEPCCITNKITNGVQAHDIEGRLNGFKGRLYHIPLVQPLTGQQQIELNTYFLSHAGKHYDWIGAVRSANPLWRWFYNLFSLEERTAFFCSELVLDCYKQLNILKVRSSSGWSPNKLERFLRRKKLVNDRVHINDKLKDLFLKQFD